MQLACTVRERGEPVATLSDPFSIDKNHERERSACLRGAADYHQGFGQGGGESIRNFAAITGTIWEHHPVKNPCV